MAEIEQEERRRVWKVRTRARTGISALQVELRRLFQAVPPHVAMLESLARMGEYFTATYAAVHARLGTRFLSEEWTRPGFKAAEELPAGAVPGSPPR